MEEHERDPDTQLWPEQELKNSSAPTPLAEIIGTLMGWWDPVREQEPAGEREHQELGHQPASLHAPSERLAGQGSDDEGDEPQARASAPSAKSESRAAAPRSVRIQQSTVETRCTGAQLREGSDAR